MSDLLKRLRGWRIDGTPVDETMREAADEIERLNEENLTLRKGIAALQLAHGMASARGGAE